LKFALLRDLSDLNLECIFAFVLNLPTPYRVLGLLPTPFKSKHWIALKCVDGRFHNFDSNLKEPQLIGDVRRVGK